MKRKQSGFMMYAAIGAVAVIAVLGIALKVQSARLDAAQASFEACKTRYEETLALVQKQNEAVGALEKASTDARKRAASATAAARASQATSAAEIERLRALNAKSGSLTCDDAVAEARKGMKQ